VDPFTREIQTFVRQQATYFPSIFAKNGLSLAEGDLSSIESLSQSYSAFLAEREAFEIEEVLKKEFPLETYIALGFPSYTFPRFYRLLPRIDERKGLDGVKKRFSHLPSLRRHLVDKAHVNLYREINSFVHGTLVILNWVLPGLGDFVAAQEIAQFLREQYPKLNIEILALVPMKRLEQIAAQKAPHTHLLGYEKDFLVRDFPKEMQELLQKASMILQAPTFYPHFLELLHTFPHLKAETLGEYGFVDSAWCHPNFLNRQSMGLHVLEKGILIKTAPSLSEHEDQGRFFFAYLVSIKGTTLYLHALLTLLEEKTDDIYLSVASFAPLAQLFAQHVFPFKEYGIKEVCIEVEGHRGSLKVLNSGKTLHIKSLSQASKLECQTLFLQSCNPVVCRGDQSFSEALSYGKVFFYDPLPHAKPFLEDLYALAACRLWDFPSALKLLRLPLLLLEPDCNLEAIGKEAGILLKDPLTAKGFQMLSQIVKEEHSVHPFLFSLINRAFCHLENPLLEKQEHLLLEELAQGRMPFSSFIQNIKTLLTRIAN